MCGGASQRIYLSVLARSPHKGLAHEISHETGKKTKEGRSQRSVGMSAQAREGWVSRRERKRAVDRTGQLGM